MQKGNTRSVRACARHLVDESDTLPFQRRERLVEIRHPKAEVMQTRWTIAEKLRHGRVRLRLDQLHRRRAGPHERQLMFSDHLWRF